MEAADNIFVDRKKGALLAVFRVLSFHLGQ